MGKQGVGCLGIGFGVAGGVVVGAVVLVVGLVWLLQWGATEAEAIRGAARDAERQAEQARLKQEASDQAARAKVQQQRAERHRLLLETAELEIAEIEADIERLKEESALVAEHIEHSDWLELYAAISDRPDVAPEFQWRQGRLQEIGPVSASDLDAFQSQMRLLVANLREAKVEMNRLRRLEEQ